MITRTDFKSGCSLNIFGSVGYLKLWSIYITREKNNLKIKY